MQVVSPREAGELLPRPESEAELVRAADRAEHRSVAVDRHPGEAVEVGEARKPTMLMHTMTHVPPASTTRS